MSTEDKTTESLLSNTRKADYKLRKSQFEYANAKVANEKASFDNNMDELNQLQAKNEADGNALNKNTTEVLSRNLVSAAAYSAVDKVSTLFKGTTEVQDITQRVADLAVSKQTAIKMQKKLVAQSEGLAQKKEKVEKAKQKMLDVETDSIKKEIELEEEKIEQLNQSQATDVGNEPNMSAAVAKWEMNNAELKASNEKISDLKEKQSANIAAKEEANQARRTPADLVIQQCPTGCEATKITVNCKHHGRTAKTMPNKSISELHVISASMQTDKQYVDMISIAIEGNCGKGKSATSPSSALAGLLIRDEAGSHCPYAVVSGGEPGVDIKLPGTAGNTLDVYVYSPSVEKSLIKPTWLAFFEYAFIPKENQYTTYTIVSKGCNGVYDGLQTRVYAHTYVKWAGNVSMAWSKSNKESTKPVGDGTEIDLAQTATTKWEIKGKIAGIYDGRAYDVECSLNNFFTGFRNAISGLATFMNRVEDHSVPNLPSTSTATDTTKNDIVKFEVNYPKIILDGSYDTLEDPKGNSVDTKFKIALKMNPLIGVKISVDILQALLNIATNVIAPGALPAGKKFASYIKKVLAKVKGLETEEKETENEGDKNNTLEFNAAIVLTAEGNLVAELNWSKKIAGEALAGDAPSSEDNNTAANKNKGAIGGEAGVSLKMQLKGEIIANIKHTNTWFVVNASLGAGFNFGAAQGGLPAELAIKLFPATIDDKPAIGGRVSFNGLTLYYMAYVKASLKSAKNIDNQDNADQRERNEGFGSSISPSPKSADNTPTTINENATAWAIIPLDNWPPLNKDPKALLLLSDTATKTS